MSMVTGYKMKLLNIGHSLPYY